MLKLSTGKTSEQGDADVESGMPVEPSASAVAMQPHLVDAEHDGAGGDGHEQGEQGELGAWDDTRASLDRRSGDSKGVTMGSLSPPELGSRLGSSDQGGNAAASDLVGGGKQGRAGAEEEDVSAGPIADQSDLKLQVWRALAREPSSLLGCLACALQCLCSCLSAPDPSVPWVRLMTQKHTTAGGEEEGTGGPAPAQETASVLARNARW